MHGSIAQSPVQRTHPGAILHHLGCQGEFLLNVDCRSSDCIDSCDLCGFRMSSAALEAYRRYFLFWRRLPTQTMKVYFVLITCPALLLRKQIPKVGKFYLQVLTRVWSRCTSKYCRIFTPHFSFLDWKLEQNPVSGFLSLLRNVLHRHPYNTEQLQRGSNIAIVGSLMHKVFILSTIACDSHLQFSVVTQVHPSLLDVQVLMAVQLLVEFARDFHDPNLLQSLYQYLLFDMRIWARSPFHVRIGHVQYLTNLVREDRATFRKKYGTQYLLDTIKQHYNNGDSCDLSLDDRKTMRQSLLGIIKLYINKEITINDMSAILGFLFSVRDNEMVRR